MEKGSMVSVGDIIEGTITGVMPFGAFVDLGNRRAGLVHISEVAQSYVKDINEHLKKGDKVKVKVLKIDDAGKISLSIRQVEQRKPENMEKKPQKKKERREEHIRPDDFDWNQRHDTEMSFEDKLSRFKQISDENIQAIRRSTESKRSGGYSRRGNY